MLIKTLLGHKTLLVGVVTYTILITLASLYRFIVSPFVLDFENSDKVLHFISYFIFEVIWFFFLYFSARISMNWKRSLWTSGVVCFVYGILMELAQGFLTTYRSMDWKDAIANTTGIVFAVIVLIISSSVLFKLKEEL
ncbi:MAG: hypothetical protein CL613_09080 [Aquimarina sp.]|nr:hypothetical protein [Aquimarina sp.]